MKNSLTIIVIFISLKLFSQTNKIYTEINFNTFSHSSLKQFQQEFKNDLIPIPVKTVDNFPANIGFTVGIDLAEKNIGLFGSYNFTGGKISYSDYSGSVKVEEEVNAITFGGIYYIDIFKNKRLKFGVKAFGMYSTLKLDSYSKISNNINQESLGFKSFDIGTGGIVIYEYPLSFIIIRANLGIDLVLGGKLKFDNNSKFHLQNDSNNPVKTGWTGLRSGLGISIPF